MSPVIHITLLPMQSFILPFTVMCQVLWAVKTPMSPVIHITLSPIQSFILPFTVMCQVLWAVQTPMSPVIHVTLSPIQSYILTFTVIRPSAVGCANPNVTRNTHHSFTHPVLHPYIHRHAPSAVGCANPNVTMRQDSSGVSDHFCDASPLLPRLVQQENSHPILPSKLPFCLHPEVFHVLRVNFIIIWIYKILVLHQHLMSVYSTPNLL